VIAVANRAFAKLVGQEEQGVDGVVIGDTTLATFVPGILRALRLCHVDGRPTERRAKIHRGADKPLELTLWLTPLPMPGTEIHMLVRIEEIDSRGDER
jgi:hypothetical protein